MSPRRRFLATRLAGAVGCFLGVALLGGAGSSPAQSRDITVEGMRAENRLALVVGNAAYATSPLRNPVNDARAMAQTLRDLGFDVILRENVNENAMKRAINEFGDRLGRGGVGLFFYAGHAMQMGGRNYLIPIGAEIRTEADVDVESIDVNRVLARMEGARNRLNIVVLDACRDNPFARSFRSGSRGLVPIDAPSGTMIAYATAPGRLARDGDGPNGLYTGELLRAMREPGLRLEEVFKRVRSVVRQQTTGEQVPWEASSVEGDFFFNLKSAALAPTTAKVPRLESREGPAQEVRSLSGDVATEITFENRSQRTIVVYWIDYSGKEILYRRLVPGQSYDQPTYVSHPWRIREEGSAVEIKTVVGGSLRNVIVDEKDFRR